MGRWLKRAVLCLVALAPWTLHAQVLDFEGVCPAPPCPIGTLYAPSGVSFSPSTELIVAAGTNLLTGPIGGQYLSISNPPYQMTIMLARQATFFSMQLARSGTSSGTVTVAVTWLKQGTVVGSTSVVLNIVNTWLVATASVPGGFDTLALAASGGPNASFGLDGLQLGGTCNGFADVQPTDAFCSATEWLANREVTTGCGPGAYCPNDNVTRWQMALFMNRVGNALTPTLLGQTQTGITGTFQTAVVGCQTQDVLVTGYPRTATGTASLRLRQASAQKSVDGQIALSTDGGATWATPDFFFGQVVQPNSYASVTDLLEPTQLAVGRSYRFGVFLLESALGSVPTASVTVDCQLSIRIDNRISTSAPFDPPAGGRAPGQVGNRRPQ